MLFRSTSMQQRLAPRKADCLMRQLGQELVDISRCFICIQWIDNLPKTACTWCYFYVAHRMRTWLIFRIAVAAMQIASLEPYEKLAAAYRK